MPERAQAAGPEALAGRNAPEAPVEGVGGLQSFRFEAYEGGMTGYRGLPSAEAIQRGATRLVLEFLIKAVPSGARVHGGSLERSLTYFAIQHANVERLSRGPGSGLAVRRGQ